MTNAKVGDCVKKKLRKLLQGGNNSDVMEMCEDSSFPRGYVHSKGVVHT